MGKITWSGFGVLMTAMLFFAPSASFAQQKIGYIDLEEIRQTYKGFKDAESLFQKTAKELQDKARLMQEDVERLKQQYESRRMMLTEEKRQEDERDIVQKEQELLKLVQSSQMELAQKEAELTRPLQEKIFSVVQGIAKAENYTYVFDAASLIYVDPLKASDLTAQVLEELQKEVK